MIFLAKRRSGSAWEDATSLPKRPQHSTAPEHAQTPAAWGWDPTWTWDWQETDWSRDWEAWTWEGETKRRKIEDVEAINDQNQKKVRKKLASKEPADTSVGSGSAVLGQSTLPKNLVGMRFSGVVNAIEPKSGNLLIDCPTVSQIFGRPPSIKPDDNRMNARVGSMVVFGLLPGETPIATEVVINGFDSEIGMRPDPVQNDNCDVAGLLPGKGKKRESYKGKNWGGKSACKAAKGSPKGALTGKGRGKASALSHVPWQT
eukprot:Skav226664  [mRNA]  locus=scaffold861:26313:27089:+ [translate_table: standard]